MGLDSYASRRPIRLELTTEDKQAFEQSGIELCGGMWSGVGDSSSFRGKVYVDVVDRVAGASLQEAWTPPEELRDIAAAFECCDPALVARESMGDRYPVSEAEVLALGRFFRLCAQRGLGLIGWW